MKGEAVAIIPARYASTRLPGKALLPLNGIPLIVHVLNCASRAAFVSRALVATDDERIAEAVAAHGGEAIMTSADARSGTDRVAEAAESIGADIVVNVQGDEPLIQPATIDAAIRPLLDDPRLQISTTSEPVTSVEDALSPDVVKVVTDSNGYALYFSRSPIPFIRSGPAQWLEGFLRRDERLLTNYRKHTGLYVYRNGFLQTFARLKQTPLELMESLEQLRALEHGYRIRVVEVEHRSIGVDTLQDYERVKRILEEKAS